MSQQSHRTSCVIQRPLDEVFEFATDFEQFPRWFGVAEVHAVKELADRIGSEYELIYETLLSKRTVPVEITRFEPLHTLAFKDSLRDNGEIVLSFETVYGGTTITLEYQSTDRPLFRLLTGASLQRQVQGLLKNLKQQLEPVTEPVLS